METIDQNSKEKEPIIEADLTSEQVEAIHRFGECWITGYDRNVPQFWQKSLWLWASDRPVIWKNGTIPVPSIRPPGSIA